MTVGFIGLGNLGYHLAKNLKKAGMKMVIHDITASQGKPLLGGRVCWAETPKELSVSSDTIITCLPSPEVAREVMESKNGVIAGLSKGKIWLEMSTTSDMEVIRLGKKVGEKGALAADCPVSGGCHRAVSGNISIFSGCNRKVFVMIKPLLLMMGQKILHTGNLGSASVFKVMTNYLATANLISCCEALTTMSGSGFDLKTAYQAIKISSGNSFVNETESQVILNGSRNINFTMGLVLKDLKLFQKIADRNGIPLEISPKLIEIFKYVIKKFGHGENSPSIVKRLEEATGQKILAKGFPAEIVDDKKKQPGREVIID